MEENIFILGRQENVLEAFSMKFLFKFFLFSFISAFCLLTQNLEKGWWRMDKMIEALKKEDIEFYLFERENGNGFVVVPSFGARIMGAFIEGENLFWTHPDLKKGQGGQRTWISPEGGDKGFIFKPDWSGNRDFSMLDPGNYKVISCQNNRSIALKNSFRTISNDGKEDYNLELTREMSFAENPLEKDPDFKNSDLKFLGIDFVHKLKNRGERILDRVIGLWALIQIIPQGTMIVPVEKPSPEVYRGNYFEPLPPEFVRLNRESISFFVHGSRRYKIGIKPEYAKGSIAYISKNPAGEFYIVMMNFPVDKNAKYPDRPRIEQHTNGDVIQIYSHLEKSPFAFGELECHSPSLYLLPEKEESFRIKIYILKGSKEWIIKAGKKLASDDFDKAYLFVR